MNIYTVHSDPKRKPRYYVTAVVFESDSASEAIQWAINQADKLEVQGTLELKDKLPVSLKDNVVIKGQVWDEKKL